MDVGRARIFSPLAAAVDPAGVCGGAPERRLVHYAAERKLYDNEAVSMTTARMHFKAGLA